MHNAGVRVDTWVETGTEISPFYDSLIAKLMVHAPDRPAAVARMQLALDATELSGIPTNLGYLRAILASEAYGTGLSSICSLFSCGKSRPCTFELHMPAMQAVISAVQQSVIKQFRSLHVHMSKMP